MFLLIGGLFSILWVIPTFCPPGDGFGVPPATFPYVLTGFITFLALLNGIQALNQAKDEEKETPAEKEKDGKGRKQILLILAAIVLTIPGFTYLGFLITGVLFLVAFQYLLGQRSPLIIAIVSLCLPCLLYVVLWHGLRIPLP